MNIRIINTVAITSPANPAPRGRPVNRARSLTPDQRERLRAQGYCVRYASPDHWVINCPLEPYSPRARRASRASRASPAGLSPASPASRANRASPANPTGLSPANRASPANPTSRANRASRASPASPTGLSPANPANRRGANIALLDSTNDDLADALSDLSDTTENREILDHLDWTKYL